MAKGKVVSSQVEKGKAQEKGLRLTQVQEEGLSRAFARKAILSPRYSFQWTNLAGCWIDANDDDYEELKIWCQNYDDDDANDDDDDE